MIPLEAVAGRAGINQVVQNVLTAVRLRAKVVNLQLATRLGLCDPAISTAKAA